MNPNGDAARLIVTASEQYDLRGGASRLSIMENDLRATGEPEAIEAAELVRHMLSYNRDARRAEHDGNRREEDSAEASIAALAEQLRDLGNEYRCEGCGEPSEPGRDLAETILSPPVSGHRLEQGLLHSDCADAYARSLVE